VCVRDRWILATQPTASDDVGGANDAPAGTDEDDLDVPPPAAHKHSALIVAAPVHEAGAFLPRKTLDALLGRGRHKDFVKERVSAAVVFAHSLALPFAFGVVTIPGSAVTVAISETSRAAAGGAGGAGGASAEEVWVLQSATDWARRALDDELAPEAMADELLRSFAAALGRDRSTLPPVLAAEAVVWPYGDMDYALEEGCAWLDESALALCGDWAYNGRVEGAWLSGRAAARKVLAARTD
jgi:predicted NAD/FAD-dependent oxidoreductase